MASDETIKALNDAEDTAKLALLQQITSVAANVNVAAALKDLALAYSLTVGARIGRLPGVVDMDVKK